MQLNWSKGKVRAGYHQEWLLPEAAEKCQAVTAGGLPPVLDERRGVEFFPLKAKSILNRCANGDMPFAWTINPYRGCEFGCKYCYARYTHEYLGLEDSGEFERKIFVKVNAPELLAREVGAARASGRLIAIGTATDPYQPAERQFKIMRRLLEVLVSACPLRVSLTTKSTLVARDLDLLLEVHKKGELRVNISLITLNSRLARLFEPRAPTPAKRLETVTALSRAGLNVGLIIAPVLPALTDHPAQLEELIRAAAQAGARFVYADTLRLRSAARREFLPLLSARFPKLYEKYRAAYQRSPELGSRYAARLRELVAELWAKYSTGEPAAGDSAPRQAELF